jgi:hypothetical protein
MQDHPTIGCQMQLKIAPSPTERHANMLVRFSSRMAGEVGLYCELHNN